MNLAGSLHFFLIPTTYKYACFINKKRKDQSVSQSVQDKSYIYKKVDDEEAVYNKRKEEEKKERKKFGCRYNTIT